MSDQMVIPEAPKKHLSDYLAEACNEVGGVAKGGRNTMQNYDYVKAADVAKAIRHELFKRGVVILADETSLEWKEFQTKSGGTMKECTLKITYHIIGHGEEILMAAYGVAQDSGDKAIYKAKTGALKYFLRGLGLIPDEADDPENDEDERKTLKKTLKVQERVATAKVENEWNGMPINEGRIKVLQEACAQNGRTKAEIDAVWAKTGIKGWHELTNAKYDNALRWATNAPNPAKTPEDQRIPPGSLEAISKQWRVPLQDLKQFAEENPTLSLAQIEQWAKEV